MGTTIQAALAAAGLVNRQIGNKSPSVMRGQTHDMRTFMWQHPEFGNIQVAANFNMAVSAQQSSSTWARLLAPHGDMHRIKCIKLGFTALVKSDVRVLVFNETDMIDMSHREQFPEFDVPVRWENDHMFTHMPKGDDRDIVFLRQDGTFVNYEVSVITRKDQSYVCGQELYCAQIVVMTIEEAQEYRLRFVEIDGKAVTAVPLYSENAYPDHEDAQAPFRNYIGTLPSAEQVLRYAYEHDAYIGLDEVAAAQWDPQWPTLTEKQEANGWEEGVVTFFNLVLGYGFAICKDGKPCFVHFKNIIDGAGKPLWTKGDFPVLQPMAGVILRWRENEKGRQATSIQMA